jgi:hypothetical protein
MLQHPLELTSDTGAGACFAVTVPLGESQADTAPAPAKPTRTAPSRGAASW